MEKSQNIIYMLNMPNRYLSLIDLTFRYSQFAEIVKWPVQNAWMKYTQKTKQKKKTIKIRIWEGISPFFATSLVVYKLFLEEKKSFFS